MPHAVYHPSVSVSSKGAHSPCARPISRRLWVQPGHRHQLFDVPNCETKFIPTLQHPTPALQPILCDVLHQYIQFPTLGRDLARIVPLVGKDQLVFLSVESGAGLGRVRCRDVDEIGRLE